jgi:hypothetical protein
MTFPSGYSAAGDRTLKTYSIARTGDSYVVRAGEQGILKVASRRQAVRLVTEAAELLASHPPARSSREARPGRSIGCDAGEVS